LAKNCNHKLLAQKIDEKLFPLKKQAIKCRRNGHQVSISSMLCEELLHTQIPKAQKKTVKLSVFFVLSGSGRAKADSGMWMKLTPRVNFINMLISAETFQLNLATLRLKRNPRPKRVFSF